MKNTRTYFIALFVLLFSSCSLFDSENDDDWPETGKVAVKIKSSPTLSNDSFEFTWFYGENGDGDIFGTLTNESSFVFESPELRRSLGGTSMFIRLEPEEKFSGEGMTNHTSRCYEFVIDFEYAGKKFRTEKVNIGRSANNAFNCPDGERLFLLNISLP
ncbi:hypothetical protein SAMN06295967_102332 [Belliella buryatensis]|uniref:Lipoprotein n=1 Tax=Belliella buryatensis TaxID=1500549 RepID=A0A239BG42_9BACT|nr:hypothetical protein [Belliella buryatensis]SNS06461.1 hypothetical protein SAMN06295967_102332 [Belliella buryatensis]